MNANDLNNPLAAPQSNPVAWVTYAAQLKQAIIELEARLAKLEAKAKPKVKPE